MLYGERDDLPAPYIELFTQAGYTLICMDYPLAPETELPDIVSSTLDALRAHVHSRLIAKELDGYALFGRSAGAYLAFLLTREIARNPSLTDPVGILDFYGYPSMLDEAFVRPCDAYDRLPSIDIDQIERIAHVGSGRDAANMPHITSGPKTLRYALYVYARQHEGAWHRLLGLDGRDAAHEPEAWSLTDTDLSSLPPLFIAASTGDEDIPFRISKSLARKAPQAVMKTAYYLPHDFDRDATERVSIDIYTQAISWLDELPTSAQGHSGKRYER